MNIDTKDLLRDSTCITSIADGISKLSILIEDKNQLRLCNELNSKIKECNQLILLNYLSFFLLTAIISLNLAHLKNLKK